MSPSTANAGSHIAPKLLLGAGGAVAVAFVCARLSHVAATVHLLDYLHWTIAALAAAALAWLGVRDSKTHDRAARRWFAWGFTFTLLGQLLFDVQEITHPGPRFPIFPMRCSSASAHVAFWAWRPTFCAPTRPSPAGPSHSTSRRSR